MTLDALTSFLSTTLDARLSRHRQEDPALAALELARSMAADVPAYGAFLAEHGVEPPETVEAFRRLPLLTKSQTRRRPAA